MPSTNKTQHLELNEFVGSDIFKREDWNNDNQKIDTAMKNHEDRLVKIESPAKVGHLQTGSIDSLPVGTLDGPVDNLKLEGLSLANSIFVDLQTPYNPGGLGSRLKPNATDGVISSQSAYTTAKQVVSVIAGHEWFIYAKVNQNTLNGGVGLHYSNGTNQTVGGAGDGKNEVYGTVTANATLFANPFILDNNSGNTMTTTPQSFVAINKDALGLKDFTEAQMLDLARSGYIVGLQSIMRPTIEIIGKNLFDINKSNLDFVVISSNGTLFANSAFNSSGYVVVKSNTLYTMSNNTFSSGTNVFAWYDANKNYISGGGTFGTKTSPVNAKYLRFTYNKTDEPQLEEGSTATTYEPYKSSKVTLDIPLRRVTNGASDRVYEADGRVWKEKRVSDEVKDFSTWTYSDTFERFYIPTANFESDFAVNGSTNHSDKALSNLLGPSVNFSPGGLSTLAFVLNASTLTDSGYAVNTTGARQWAVEKGFEIIYQLAQSELINLTEQGLVEGELQAFENGTVYSYSDTFHSPSLSFDVPSNQGAQITALLQSANAQAKQIAEKANKVQEDYIEPTLLNAWLHFDTTRSLKYMLDDFGFIHITGVIKGGTVTNNTVLFTLPEGYRPPANIYFTVFSGNLANAISIESILVAANGNVTIYGKDVTYNSLLSFGKISFRKA